jgi:hypothetical protein
MYLVIIYKLMEQGRGEFSLPEQDFTPAASCLEALLDLRAAQDNVAEYGPVQQLATMLYGGIPADTHTRIAIHAPRPADTAALIPIVDEVTATMSIQFRSDDPESSLGMCNLDVIRTNENPKLIWVQPQFQNGHMVRTRIRELSEAELIALQQDAEIMRSKIIDRVAERLRMGELVEAVREDGTRRFHVGDVTSVFTGWSPRDVDGIVDFLRYLTGDAPSSAQIGRFIQECKPHILAHCGELLASFMEQLQDESIGGLDLYRLINQIAEAVGPFLEVPPLEASQHAVLDAKDEIEQLDLGPDIGGRTEA